MDSSFTVKPRDRVARIAVGRTSIVRTDLSPSQSVNATQQLPALHHAPVDAPAHEPMLDAQCQSLLDREREERERRRSRNKDEALARLKAYGRADDAPPPAREDDASHADFEV